jgi:hypothetical protein
MHLHSVSVARKIMKKAKKPGTITRRRLLDALLAEALAPVDARELEAAE